MSSELQDILPAARGDAPADLVFKNARIINVFTGRIEEGNAAVAGERIIGIGDYSQAKTVIDLQGRYLAPGFIDGHTHLESSMLDVGEYARAVVPHGTTAVVTDLHEIANVSGLAGIRYVMEQAYHLPLEFFLMAPSCVPATHLETAGAVRFERIGVHIGVAKVLGRRVGHCNYGGRESARILIAGTLRAAGHALPDSAGLDLIPGRTGVLDAVGYRA